MRRFTIMISTGIALALAIGSGQLAYAQLTGADPRVSVPNVTVPEPTTDGGRPSDARDTGGEEQQLKAESERKLKEAEVKAEAERVAKEAAAKKAAEDQRIAQEKAAADKVRAEKLAAEKAAAEKVRADKIVAEKAAAEKVRAEQQVKAEAERVAKEAAMKKAAAEKVRSTTVTEPAKVRDTSTAAAKPEEKVRNTTVTEPAKVRDTSTAATKPEEKVRNTTVTEPAKVRETSIAATKPEEKVRNTTVTEPAKVREPAVVDTTPPDPSRYNTIQVNEKTAEITGTLKPKLEPIQVDLPNLIAKESKTPTESTTDNVQCRDKDYFKAHLEECRRTIAKQKDSARDQSSATLRRVRATCVRSGNPLESKSSIFDVTKVVVQDLPEPFSAGNVAAPAVIAEPDQSLRQYIVFATQPAEKDPGKILVLNPQDGTMHIFTLGDFSSAQAIQDINGTSNILLLRNANSVKYLPNAYSHIASKIKEGAMSLVEGADLKELPTNGQGILDLHVAGSSIVLSLGDAATKKPSSLLVFKSVTDGAGKSIAIPNLKDGDILRGTIVGEDDKHIFASVYILGANNQGTILKSADLMADNATLVVDNTLDADNDGKSKTMKAKNGIKKSEMAIKTKVHDKEKFEQMLADALANGQFDSVVVTHPFMDYGLLMNSLFVKEGGLGLIKTGDKGIEEKVDELLVAGADDIDCNQVVYALPVDVDEVGGKDLAVVVKNNDLLSAFFYPNINQAPKIVSIPVETTGNTILPHPDTLMEEGENRKCHWEAYQKMSDGSLKDVSSQFDDVTKCEPVFNIPGAAATQASVLHQIETYFLSLIIPSAYADDAPATGTEYRLRLTIEDSEGNQSVGEITTTVGAKSAVDDTTKSSDSTTTTTSGNTTTTSSSGGTTTSSGNTTTTSSGNGTTASSSNGTNTAGATNGTASGNTTSNITVSKVELLTPPPTTDGTVESKSTSSDTTLLVSEVTTKNTTLDTLTKPGATVDGPVDRRFAVESGGCSLIRR